MLNRITSSITTCTIIGFIAVFSSLPYWTERVIAQTTSAQDEISKLRSEVSKQGKSPAEVDQAMRDRFPNSSFPYYEPVNGCSNPIDVDDWNFGKWNRLFRTACDNHDICYTTPGKSKEYCDDQMLYEMLRICRIISISDSSCNTLAKRYYIGVDLVGQGPYNTAQKQQREYIKSVYDWLSGIAGIWESTEGTITFRQSGSNISATYTQDHGVIDGTISNNVLTGYWSESSSLVRCKSPRNGRYHWGKIRFEFTGSSFKGMWGYCDFEPKGYWAGMRKSS